MSRRRPRRRPPKTFRELVPKARGTNVLLPDREREKRMAAKTEKVPRQLWLIPVTKLYGWLGVSLLAPAVLVTGRTLCACVAESFRGDFWRTPAFWWFGIGFLMWVVWFLFWRRPVRLYVWGHEMAHALGVLLCLGSVREFRVTAKGGHILADRNNIFIALAPYFLPLYAAAGVLVFLIAGLFVDLTRVIPVPWYGELPPLHVLYWFLGLTWGFHVLFTVWMILREQPDLELHGKGFSVLFILLLNMLVLAGLLLLAAPEVGAGAFARRWLEYGGDAVVAVGHALRALGGIFGL